MHQHQTPILAADAMLRAFGIVDVAACWIDAAFVLLRAGKYIDMFVADMFV